MNKKNKPNPPHLRWVSHDSCDNCTHSFRDWADEAICTLWECKISLPTQQICDDYGKDRETG